MHLGQIKLAGAVIAAIFEEGTARPIPNHTMLDMLRRAEATGEPVGQLAAELASRHGEDCPPVLPVTPPEVWGCGCTYEASSSFRDAEHGTREGMYAHVYREERPEVFFKATARACVATGQPIGLRPDSRFTAPEPELALVLGARGRIAGYTLANDVSAWDIERENPLYLPQSKFYDGSCALGPVFVPAEDLPDPYALEITCRIERDGKEIFAGSTSTSRLHRKLETLTEFLTRANRVPAGSILLTGTGIIVPHEASLMAGDVVTISVPEIGTLVNSAAAVV